MVAARAARIAGVGQGGPGHPGDRRRGFPGNQPRRRTGGDRRGGLAPPRRAAGAVRQRRRGLAGSMMRKIGPLLNGLCLALYETGLTALGTFFTNTRLIGVRDSPWKGPLLVAGVTVWPLAGLVDALASGGLGGFLRSLAGPPSWRRAWRAALTLHGARYLLQEANRHCHPLPLPEEVTTGPSRN